MKFFKKLWKKIINPSLLQGALAIWIGSVFIAASIILTLRDYRDAVVYVCYALAAVSLAYIVYVVIYVVPRVKTRTLEIAEKYEFTHNLVVNYGFRTMAVACGSLVLNVLYCIYNGAIAIYYYSLWYSVLCAYYLFLSVMRGGLIFGTRRDKRSVELSEDERSVRAIKKFIGCGALLIIFTLLVVMGIVRLTIYEKNESPSPHLIYATALYTFIRMGFAIKNLVKARKGGDFVTQALRNIGFADALVAMLSLQTAMMSAFGNGGSSTSSALLGGAVCAAIIFIGIRMIIKGRRALKNTVKTDAEGL